MEGGGEEETASACLQGAAPGACGIQAGAVVGHLGLTGRPSKVGLRSGLPEELNSWELCTRALQGQGELTSRDASVGEKLEFWSECTGEVKT